MVDAVIARWQGDNYQARVFWDNALNLLSQHSCVVEVTFEADGPKAFDDVVVKYDPPVARSGPDRVSAEYHQIKWHVETGGRFGYEDFTEPDFIGARSFSLFERLQQARRTAPASAQFTFLTTYRVKDGDPLAALISGNDKTLLGERLFDGTTGRSRMGKGTEVLAGTPRAGRRRAVAGGRARSPRRRRPSVAAGIARPDQPQGGGRGRPCVQRCRLRLPIRRTGAATEGAQAERSQPSSTLLITYEPHVPGSTPEREPDSGQ